MRTRMPIMAVVAAMTLSSNALAQERWLVSAGGSLTRAVSDPQLELFGMGASGTAGFYRSLIPWLALGTRFTASVVSNASTQPNNPQLAAPGTGGLYTLSLSTRVRPFASSEVAARATGLWLEGGGGIARTGALWRPVVEAGVGYGINLGPIVLSPTVRYQQVIERDDALSRDDGRFASAGLEITFNDGSDEVRVRGPVFITVQPMDTDFDGLADINDLCPYIAEDRDGFRDEDGCPEHDVDRDGFADNADDCPEEPETVNGVNDYDGCPDSGALEMVNGVIIVDEKILFATNSHRIRKAGLLKLKELAADAETRETWVGLVVEGHADIRGTAAYNRKLSLLRAKAVQAALHRYGLSLPIEAVGLGESQPLDRKHHKRNRRVEIRVKEQRQRITADAGTRSMTLLETGDSE